MILFSVPQMARELCNLMSLVASHQSQSLMDSHSLAVVMTPNIMPTQHSNPANLETHLTTSTGLSPFFPPFLQFLKVQFSFSPVSL